MTATGIEACPLPPGALLDIYRRQGDYTDCYTTAIALPVSQAQYILAFYTTAVFKLERLILRWVMRRPSSDAQAAELAAGLREEFAIWRVEQRGENQLLMCDLFGRTRSWLMSMPEGAGARLYFGSAVVRESRGGEASMPSGFNALLGFHRLYSRVLLYAAHSALLRR